MKLDLNKLLISIKTRVSIQPAYRYLILSFVLSICLVVIVTSTSKSANSDYQPIIGILPKRYAVRAVEYKQPPKLSLDRKFLNRMTVHLRGTKYAGADNYTRYTVAHFGLKPLKHSRPIRLDLGPVLNDVTSFRYPISIQNCPDNIGLDRPSVLILVLSEPANLERRSVIRRTWKQHLKHSGVTSLMDLAGFAFLIGTGDDSESEESVESEHSNHGDIIQVDLVDSSENATLKIVSMLNWANSRCSRVHYLLKVDDIVYVNIRNLAATLTTLPPSDQSIYGKLMGGNVPARNKSSLYFTTFITNQLKLIFFNRRQVEL